MDLDCVNEIIDHAFADVVLGTGVSLREANAIDDYCTEEVRTAARESDEHHDWRQIPDEHIEYYCSVLCFMDLEGLRFHLPAYMRFTLNRYRDSESLTCDMTIYRLCDPDNVNSLREFLSQSQIEAIQAFLEACIVNGEDWLDVDQVPSALRRWQGNDTAVREL